MLGKIIADQATMYNGFPIFGNQYFVAKGSGAMRSMLVSDKKIESSKVRQTIDSAYQATTTGQNDVIFLSPESHSQAAAVTWAKSQTHLIGMAPPAFFNQRARIGHSADIASLWTVSGSGNLMANLYWMYGRGTGTNLNAVTVSGHRNAFHNCHIGGPMNATEAAQATFKLLTITGQENYFKDCTIGVDTIARSAANTMLSLSGDVTRNLFENCIFLSFGSAATPYFINVASTATYGWTMFKNCQFLHYSSSWATPLTVAILNSSSAGQHRLIFDANCTFNGVTDLAASGQESKILFGTTPDGGTTTGVGIAINPTA